MQLESWAYSSKIKSQEISRYVYLLHDVFIIIAYDVLIKCIIEISVVLMSHDGDMQQDATSVIRKQWEHPLHQSHDVIDEDAGVFLRILTTSFLTDMLC